MKDRGAQLKKALGTVRHKALVEMLVSKRKAAGLSQTELAKRLGQYQSFVAWLESGQRRVDVVEFLTLAEILGFDPVKALSMLRQIPG